MTYIPRRNRVLSELRRWAVINTCLASFSELERSCLQQDDSLADCAKRMGITKERVRQLRGRALEKLADTLFGPEPETQKNTEAKDN